MKKENLKVGDKVKAIKNEKYNITIKDNEWEGIVTEIGKNTFVAKTTHTKDGCDMGEEFNLEYEYFEKMDFQRDDLQFADVVTFRNGEKYVVADGALYGEDDSYSGDTNTIEDWYNDDLTQNEDDKDEDIVKVERAGQIVYERQKAVEMTVAEISEKLGYEVKIVKGK